MTSLFLALALAAQTAPATTPAAPAAAAPAPAARALKDVPNVAITYYDVTGKDMKAINKSIQKQRKARGGAPDAVAYNWDLGADIKTRTVDGACTVTDVTPSIRKATVELPRLTNLGTVMPAVAEAWQTFDAGNSAYVAAKLWFVHDKLPTLKAALVGKSCDQAKTEWPAQVEKLKAEVAAFQPATAVTATAAQSSGPPQQLKPNE